MPRNFKKSVTSLCEHRYGTFHAYEQWPAEKRIFLFPRGSHKPFSKLKYALEGVGRTDYQIGFDQSVNTFWTYNQNFLAFTQLPDAWLKFLQKKLGNMLIKDLVIFKGTRLSHKALIQAAHANAMNVHIFEESYLKTPLDHL